MADRVDLPLDREVIELIDRQGDKDLDAVFEFEISSAEGLALLGLGAVDRGGVRYAPMGGDGITRPHRTGFGGGPVAHRKDEIHDRGTQAGEFVPAFAAQPRSREMVAFEFPEG
jgi:hypothetical protein